MGCLKSKSYTPDEKASNGPNGTPACAPEGGEMVNGGLPLANLDQIGFTTRQVFCLKQSWKGIKRKMEETGVEMFVRLFKTNENLQYMFQKFKDIESDDELRSNEALEYHATMVMTTLDEAITHIDNYSFVVDLLTQTGASHKRFKDFEPTTFLRIKQPFLDAVRVTLGDRYTENMQNIYSIAINFIVDTLIEGLREAKAKEKSSTVTATVISSGNSIDKDSNVDGLKKS